MKLKHNVYHILTNKKSVQGIFVKPIIVLLTYILAKPPFVQ